MPQVFGRDRLQQRSDGTLVLSSPYPKRWVGRVEKTLTHSEFPGTAVEWDDALYEVVEVSETMSSGRYVLAPWREDQIIRTVSGYNETSEAFRIRRHAALAVRMQKAGFISLMGVFLGHLPQLVQENIENAYGVRATRLTTISCVPFLLFGVFCARHLPIQGITHGPQVMPNWMVAVGFALFAESLVRLKSVLSGKGMGSLAGTFSYWIWWVVYGRKRPPLFHIEEEEEPRAEIESGYEDHRRKLTHNPFLLSAGSEAALPKKKLKLKLEHELSSAIKSKPDDVVSEQDAYTIREPYLGLLPAEEQKFLSQKYGFDFQKTSIWPAVIILIFSMFGVISMWSSMHLVEARITKWISLLTALYLGAEQIYRLVRIQSGHPTGSVLGIFVKPLTRNLFVERPPENPPPPPPETLPDVWDGESGSFKAGG